MRIPGIGGEVLKEAGGIPVTLPGGELFTALQTGVIDATEWVGPYNDLTFGFHQAAKYYYYPGWHEPGPMLELLINIDAWNSLPNHLQVIIEHFLVGSFIEKTDYAAPKTLVRIFKLVDLDFKTLVNTYMSNPSTAPLRK